MVNGVFLNRQRSCEGFRSAEGSNDVSVVHAK